MIINFKSIRTEMDGDENIIEFNSKLETDFEDEFKCLIFNENRNNKIITNRLEYSSDTLRIYSGITSLHCKLNEVVKNNLIINEHKQSFFIYTKMINMNVEDENNLIFEYLICTDDKFEHNTNIKLELKITN